MYKIKLQILVLDSIEGGFYVGITDTYLFVLSTDNCSSKVFSYPFYLTFLLLPLFHYYECKKLVL